MINTSLGTIITQRKSVRSISDEPLAPSVLLDILAFTQNIDPLFPSLKTAVQMLSRSEIKTFASIFAPHYLAIYAERSPDADLNIGYILQQTDLYLSSKGLGSCWLGIAQPVEGKYEGLPFVIMLAIGESKEAIHRTSIEQFKRKPVSEISTITAVPQYIEAIRLAPSAMNKQPWFFSGEEHYCHAFSVRGKGLINIAEGWRFVDLGIALAHLSVAAATDGKVVTFKREDSIPIRSGSEYVLSCRVE